MIKTKFNPVKYTYIGKKEQVGFTLKEMNLIEVKRGEVFEVTNARAESQIKTDKRFKVKK